ncbi:MAG: hypothetical protein F6K30_24375 [Cyanothece sp. SIO2G6]|nr:hypothetical protein [Cyanothece sp. SIO2G6]
MSNASDPQEMSAFDKERMHDIQLLLNNLFRREEATVLMVLDCLYDVGAKHLIDQKIRIRWGQRVAGTAIRPVKPLFKAIAIRWFKQNVPQLLSDWLYSQVSFEPDDREESTAPEAVSALPASNADLPPQALPNPTSLPQAIENSQGNLQEIERLQRQVRLLAGVSIVAIATLIGTLIT